MAIHIRYIETHRASEQNKSDYSDSCIPSWREDKRQHNERNEQDKGKEVQALPNPLADGDDGIQVQSRRWSTQQK